MMVKIRKISLLFSLLCAVATYGQVYINSEELTENATTDSQQFTIIRIDLAGNEKTKDYVILRELYFDAGDSLSLADLFLAQKRVLNLFLFNRVIFDLVGDAQNGVILIITVSERWYIFPLPILYLNDRSWQKISYGAKLLYYNFLGRNILLNLTAAFGYDPQFKLSYRDLWFGGDLKLLTNFYVFRGKVKSRSLQVEPTQDERVGFDWLFGKRFGNYLYLLFDLSYTELRHNEIALATNGIDKLPCLMLSLQYDNRDLKEYPHRGYQINLWGRKTKYRHPINYARYGADARSYFPLSASTTLALRASIDLSRGLIPLYDRAFIGYLERIRGQFYEKYEGENMCIGAIEFRFPIRKIRYYDLSEFALPGFESYYQDLKFGISAGIFYDYGAVWYQHESLSRKHFIDGFGAGLHFHVPYIDVLRMEIGFDRDFNDEYILEIGVPF